MTEDLKQKIKESVDKTGTASPSEAERAGAVAQRTAADDPVLTNALNQEPLIQSGVVWTGSLGVLSALGAILTQVGRHGTDYGSYDYNLLAWAIGTLLMTVGTLYRRIAPGLKPLFWRWTHHREA